MCNDAKGTGIQKNVTLFHEVSLLQAVSSISNEPERRMLTVEQEEGNGRAADHVS